MNLTVVFFVLEQLVEAMGVLGGSLKQYVSPPLHFKVDGKRRRLKIIVEEDD